VEEGEEGKEKSRRKSGTCGNATKSATKREASAPCKGKGVGRRKEIEESRGSRGSTRGQAIKSIAKMGEELNRRAKEESRGTL